MGIQSGPTLAVNGVIADFGSEVVRDKSGAIISLRPQAFAVLRYLTENAGRLVTKDELMRAVWLGTAVTDDSLVQCIHDIRRALRDEEHALLKTVPRQGYRLVLPAEGVSDQSASDGAVRMARLGIGAGALLLLVAATSAWWLFRDAGGDDIPSVGPPVVAVLPFDNLGDEPEQGYFADGITEDLITDLSKLSGILVIARNSTWPYKDKPTKPQQVAKDLGARYILEGSVRRDGDHVRINAQLIDAIEGHHLWADRYDGALSDVFALQDKVIGQIVTALAVELTSQEYAEIGRPETEDPQAYDAVLQGWNHYRLDTEEETKKAIDLFEKAIELDPDYGRAHAAMAAASWKIARSYWESGTQGGFQHAYDRTLASLAKAEKQPNSLAHAVHADVMSRQGRYSEAFAAIGRAMSLAPNDPENHIIKARILNATGHAAEAEKAVRWAMRLDPLFPPDYLRELAISLFHQERYEEALDALQSLVSLQSDFVDDYTTLVSCLGHLGRLNEVPAAVSKFNELNTAAGYNLLTVQMQGYWWWYGDIFDYDPAYRQRLADGLRRAGVEEGAGTDIPFEEYSKLVTKTVGEYDVAGATKVNFEAAKLLHDRGVIFVDVRAAKDFRRGHIPGAVNLDVATEFSKESLTRVAGKDSEIAVSCHGKYCNDSTFAAAKAVSWGFTHVYYFAGGFPAWKDAGYPVETSSQ